MIDAGTPLAGLIQSHRDEVSAGWLTTKEGRFGNLSDNDFLQYAGKVLNDLAYIQGDWDDPSFAALKEHLVELSRAAALRGATPRETATLIFSLKDALGPVMRPALADGSLTWEASEAIHRLIDRMGLHTFETFVASREEMIREQQRSIMELSTPVV